MANQSIIDVGFTDTVNEEDSLYINSEQSLKQIKKKNLKLDYSDHIENKPSINNIELSGSKTLEDFGIASLQKNTAKGSHITVNNSAGAFFEGMKLFGKSEQVQTKGYQLFDASKLPTKSIGGATVTNNGDGSFTVSGSGNLTEYFGVNYQITDKEVIKNLFKTGKLYLKNLNTFPYFHIYFVNNDGSRTIELRNEEATITEDILNNVARVVFSIYGDTKGAIVPGTIRPMLYQSGDGTWEPYTGGKPSPSMEYKQDPESSGDGGTIGIGVRGNNLYYEGDLSISDVKYTDFIPWTGKSEMFASLRAKTNSVDGRLDVVIDYYDANKVRLGGNGWGEPCGNTFTKYSAIFTGRSAAGTGKNVDLRVVRFFKARFGISAATQIDYKDIVITDSEGVKFSGYQPPQTLTIPTPNGLPGIKVTSGGNYTDENGQQWICDELDFKRRKYVQRVRKQVFDGSESWGLSKKGTYQTFEVAADNAGGNGICDTFRFVATDGSAIGFSTTYANRVHLITGHNALEEMKGWLAQHPVTVYYQLQTPIETDIPEEVMKAYRKLYTNSPTTVIQNGDNAYMEVDYATYTCRANKEDVKDLVDRIEDLQSYVGYYTDNHVVGLQVDYKNKTFKRLAGAKYLKPGSDFNKYKMFGGRRKCIVEDSGKIVAWHGDKNYTEDGSLGQVMVYQPAFYYRVQPLELDPIDTGIGHHLRKANYYVSDIPSPGFKRHPAFYDAEGNEIDYFLTSAYEGSIWDADGGSGTGAYLLKDEQVMNLATDKFCSIAGVKPASGLTQNLTRPNIEQMAQNRGTGWHGDLIKQVSAEQMLMIIEIGMMNLQTAIAQGVVSIADNSAYNCSSLTGSTSSIGNGTGRATETTNTKGDTSTKETADGKTSVCWRGKENFWGNIWKFVYGINIWGNGKMGGGQPYICKDFNFVENKNSDNYEGAGFTATNANGYISAMGYSTACDWLFIASECLGNSSLPVGDYTYITVNLNGYRIARLGGCWNYGGSAGGFCWPLDGGVGGRVPSFGGRLVYIPTRDSEPYKSNLASWRQEVSK